MWVLTNCLLLMVGAVAAVFGISFYLRNRDTSGNMRIYILLYGVFSAIWCISYGLIGIIDDFAVCEALRKPGIASFEAFMVLETFIVTEMTGIKKPPAVIIRTLIIVLNIADFFIYSVEGMDIYERRGAWTTWRANPDYSFNRSFHTVYMVLMFLVLFVFWIYWFKNVKMKRMRNFLFMLCIANFMLIFFSLPDAIFPTLGLPAVSTSGLGGAVCTIVVWLGATRLNSFDIRMGNITEKLFDFIDAGIIAFGTEHETVMVNRYAKQQLEGVDLEGAGIADLFDVDEVTEKEMFSKSLDDIYSARLWDREGSRAYSVSMSAMKDRYGDPFCFLLAFFDVTEEVDTARQLERASNAKSHFLAQMSHEIRTPINAVLGMNEMILRESKDKDILEYSENIDSAGNTLLALINSILDFSKIEDGKMDIIPVKYDTASLVNDLVNSISQRADAKGLELKLDIDSSLPCTLFGDDVRFSQIIMNLLTNAVKYTEKGSVTFAMRAEEKVGENVMLYVSVKDTGIGIKKEDMDRLAISFERLDEKKNRNIEGTGLGMSIVTSLLEMMGSRLYVESTYGEGSQFYFTLKQKVVDDTPIGDYGQAVKRKREAGETDDVIHAPGAKVLLVDDNDMNLAVAGNLLKLCGVKADMASSGAETISIMEKKTYDIVFLDHMMPEMDGVETLQALKERKLIPPSCKMIVLTANAVVGAREKYLENGFDDYLSKPMVLADLSGMLKKHLPESAYEE
ncbi:MAG: response regulator [Lachnospiraceae bacterium]|nr:response regulator [Lachnospiraceae bacterium]